ncbi:hypothetical protein ACJMK2_003928 [Sinanodonta woodiana]|uniref:Mitochondrial inner membrane protein Mpv17 n=1 Tax=Sinanodonta woodiana TaxID=1069815 RepID=A0ABD3Y1E3_SINWO
MAAFPRVWRAYLGVLQKYPLRTMACTTGTLMCAGDFIAQVAIEKRGFYRLQKYEVKRSLRFLGYGLILAGPIFGVWYAYLDKTFRVSKFGNWKMVFFDQCVFTPIYLLYFFTVMGALKGDSWAQIKVKIQKDYFDVLLTCYKIWPLAQACNFTFVPVQHRVLVTNVVAVGWNTYLAWKSASDDES